MIAIGPTPCVSMRLPSTPDNDPQAFGRVLGITDYARAGYLAWVLRRLPETLESFRTIHFVPAPSQIERRLAQLQRKPHRVAQLIERLGGSLSLEGLGVALQANPLLPLVFYQFAVLLRPKGQAERKIADGSAHLAFLDAGRQLPRIRVAIRNARAEAMRRTRPGKGGDRRGDWSSLETLAIEHLLGVCHDATQTLPGYSYDPVGLKLHGPTAAFLRACLGRAGLRVSETTLRRRIDEYRHRHAKHATEH